MGSPSEAWRYRTQHYHCLCSNFWCLVRREFNTVGMLLALTRRRREGKHRMLRMPFPYLLNISTTVWHNILHYRPPASSPRLCCFKYRHSIGAGVSRRSASSIQWFLFCRHIRSRCGIAISTYTSINSVNVIPHNKSFFLAFEAVPICRRCDLHGNA